MTEEKIDQAQNQDVQFMIQRIYIKDSSFEAPDTPASFQRKWEPNLSLDIDTQHTKLEENVYEVVLTVTASVKNQDAIAFLAEVKQAGIFTVQGAGSEQLNHLLESFCPGILFPYAREVITTQAIHGSFPQLVLAPINFDALYMQKLEEKKQQATTQTEAAH